MPISIAIALAASELRVLDESLRQLKEISDTEPSAVGTSGLRTSFEGELRTELLIKD